MEEFKNSEMSKKQTEKLMELFDSQYPEAHKVAAWAISMVGEPAVPQALKAIPTRFSSPRNERETSAIREIEWAINLIGDPAIPHLKEALNDENQIAASFATRLLKEMDAIDVDSTIQVFEASKKKIQEIVEPDIQQHVKVQQMGFLNDQLNELIESMANVADENAVRTLSEIFTQIREQAIFMQEIPHQSRRDRPKASTLKDSLQYSVIRTLSEMGEPGVKQLIDITKGLNPSDRLDLNLLNNTIKLLSENKSQQARDYLISLLSTNSSDQIMQSVINSVRQGSNPEPLLIELLGHEKKMVQQLAVDALSWVKKNQ